MPYKAYLEMSDNAYLEMPYKAFQEVDNDTQYFDYQSRNGFDP